MKNATGPVVSGRPTSQPPTDCPHRRPTSVAPPISAGVTTSLSVRLSTGGRDGGARRGQAVPGGHYHPDAGIAERANGFRGGVLDGIGHGDEARQLPANGYQHHRSAFLAFRFCHVRQWRRIDAGLPHHHSVAECDDLPIHASAHADTGARFEIGGGLQCEPLRFRGGDNGGSQRVFAALIETRRQCQNRF